MKIKNIIAILLVAIVFFSCAPIVTPQPQVVFATETVRAPTTTMPTAKPTFTPTPTPKPIAQRIADRSFPSVFQAWSEADNLPNELPIKTVARHDLVWYVAEQLGLKWDNKYTGLGTSFTPESLLVAQLARKTMLDYNPNLILLAALQYRDAQPDWLPQDSPWWAHDANGNRIGGPSEYGVYLLDTHNPSFRTQVVAQAKALIDTGDFDGIMLDWWDDTDPDRISLVKEIRSAIGEDKLIIVNTNWRTAPNSAAYVNGLYMEDCFWYPQRPVCLTPLTPQEWQKTSDTLLWAEANLRQPHINALETWYVNSRNDLNRMRATTTLALTHSNGYALFAGPDDLPTEDHLHNWYPFWDKTLGKPFAAMFKRSDGAFQREFEGGTVIYNPMGNGAISVIFTEPRISAATSQSATTFTLDTMDGDLYLNEGTTTQISSP